MYNYHDERIFNPDLPTHIDIPNVPLGSIIIGAAKYRPEHTAFIFRGEKLTYEKVYYEALLFANVLKEMGAGIGTTVATHLPTCPQAITSYYGIILSGATFSPVNPFLPKKDLLHQLNTSDADIIITHENFADRIKKIISETKINTVFITNDQEMFTNDNPLDDSAYDDNWYSLSKSKTKVQATEFDPGINPKEDLAHLAFTGGTTGTPKGCMITHSNLVSSLTLNAAWNNGCLAEVDSDGSLSMIRVEKNDEKYLKRYSTIPGTSIGLSPAPLYHVSGIYGSVLYPVIYRNTTILVDYFDPTQFLDMIEKYGVTTISGAPAMWNSIIRHPELNKYNLSTVKEVSSATAPFANEEKKKLLETFSSATYNEAYGQTETSGNITGGVVGFKDDGNIGHPLYNTKIKLVSIDGDDTEPLEPGKEGEILVKGPQVMKGYYKNPEENDDAFIDGWLRTGDIGVFDEDNLLTIVDRVKDMLIYNGYNVYTINLENILFEHPAIANVAVVGKPEPVVGEIPKAFVVLKEGADVSEQELMNFANEQVVHYAKIREIEFIAEMPLTAAGKISKNALVKLEGKSV